MSSVAKSVVPSVVLGLVAALPGCGPSMRRGFDSPEPAVRIDAIVAAAAKDDRGATRDLIRMLESDDPAARMLAIRALERITGQTNGYDYAATSIERSKAIERWQEWDAGRGGATGADARDGPKDLSGTPIQKP